MTTDKEIILHCLVVDDESIGRKLLEQSISTYPFLHHVASCKNAFEAMEVLKKEEIDLMFLDIQMPGLIGTDFLTTLTTKPMTILVTAYPQYALEGYELDILDYLMKPVSVERFTKAVNKALEEKVLRNQIDKAGDKDPAKTENIFVNVEYALVKIPKEDILYIEGMKDYVKIHLDKGKKRIITKASLTSMEEKLGHNSFMRVHKSFIVALEKIEAIRNLQITIGEHEIPVSSQKIEEVLSRIGYQS